MSEGALLIDWDNVCGALGAESLECHIRELPELLLDQARVWASERKVELSHSIAFLPARNVDRHLEESFRNAGIEVTTTSAANQAADVHIILRAVELAVEEGVDHFIIVSEDKGFLALAQCLEGRSCKCAIWAFPSERATDELRGYEHLEHLSEMLKLDPCRETLDPTQQLLACLASLALQKKHFLGFAKGHEFVAAFEIPHLTEYVDINAAWLMCERVGYFAKEPHPGSGAGERTDRRIAFGSRDVRRLFALYDEILVELSKQRRNRDNQIVNTATLLDHFDHPQLREIPPSSLIRQLVQANILAEADNGALDFAWQSTRLGIVGSLRRLAATAWTMLDAGHPLSTSALASKWPSHARKDAGGIVDDRRQPIAEGNHLVHVAIYHGLLHKGPSRGALELNVTHPIAVEAKTGLETVVRLLLAYDGGRTEYRGFLKELATLPLTTSGFHPLGQTSNEREEWLGLVVACGHTQQKAKENFVRLRNTPLVARVRAEVDTGK